MKAWLITAPSKLELADDLPIPKLAPHEALCRLLACSVCNGTDRKLLTGKMQAASLPCILGHESVGEVIEVGSAVKKFKVGDRVLRCGAVYSFGEAPYGCCWGGFAEYGKVCDLEAAYATGAEPSGFAPLNQVVPEELSPAEATQLITLKETLSALLKLGIRPGESLAVIGTGPVGLAFVHFAKLLGAGPVICIGRRKAALERAEKEGADCVFNNQEDDVAAAIKALTGGRGVDYVLDAVGSYELVRAGLDYLAPGGEVRMYGVPEPDETGKLGALQIEAGAGPVEWKVGPLMPDEASVHQYMLDLVKAGFVQPGRFITHELAFGELPKAFELLEKKQALKIVIHGPAE